MPEFIYHIAVEKDWKNALECGEYLTSSLASEGFIHCSTGTQVAQTANRYFHGQSGLLLVKIDPCLAAAEVRYEPSQGDLFPHLYGPLNLDAVVKVIRFDPDADGLFHFSADEC